MPFSMSQTRRVVSREPEMAVVRSDILRQRTVEVWPRNMCTALLLKGGGQPRGRYLLI